MMTMDHKPDRYVSQQQTGRQRLIMYSLVADCSPQLERAH